MKQTVAKVKTYIICLITLLSSCVSLHEINMVKMPPAYDENAACTVRLITREPLVQDMYGLLQGGPNFLFIEADNNVTNVNKIVQVKYSKLSINEAEQLYKELLKIDPQLQMAVTNIEKDGLVWNNASDLSEASYLL